jgi:RNA polymerase sigma factor (sigma-70 family)
MDRRTLWPRIELLYRSELVQFARVARAITGDGESALEAVQEGFADALRNAEQWSGRGSLEGWVWRCVVNRARKATPRSAPVMMRELNGRRVEGDPELRACLSALPERQRLVVFLRYFADLGYREIAETLEVEVGTISATLHAAHDSLRAALEEACT